MDIDLRVTIGWLPEAFDSSALEELIITSIIDRLQLVDSVVILRFDEGLDVGTSLYPDESTRQER